MRKTLTVIIAIILTTISAKAQIDRSQMPEPGPTPTINLGAPETVTLSNGLTVLIVENHKLPRVSISLQIDNTPHTQGEKAGVASLTSSLLGNGSTNIPKDTYNEEVDFLGASISLNDEGGYARSLSKYFDRVAELMADAAINPNFTEEELEKERKKLIEGLKTGESSAAAVSSRVTDVLLYGANHPYGEFTTEETVNKVTLADVKNYYKTYFVPQNAYMVVTGDFKTKDAKKIIKKYFGKWLSAKAPNVTVPKANPIQYTQINFVDMPNAVQSELKVVSPIDLKMADEDYPAVLVANYILGGAFGSYLNMNLREEHGYTYGARTSTSADQYSNGEFRASTKIRNAVTDSAVVETLKEIKRIRTEFVDDKDLANAKAKYLGNFIMATEDPQTIARYALNIKTKNLPENYYETFISRINAVTKEDVKRVAEKYFPYRNLKIVIVGKGSEVLHKLENIDFEGKKLPVFYFDKYGNKIERPVFSKPIPEGVTAKTVLMDYIEAIGGMENVNNVKTLSMKGIAETQGMTLNMEAKKTKDGRAYQALILGGNVVQKQVIGKDTGYVLQQGQKKELTAEELKEEKAEATTFTELVLLENPNIELTGIETVDGKDMYVIKTNDTEKLYYATTSHLKISKVKTIEANGQTYNVITTFSDYKEYDGVKIPLSFKQVVGPQEVVFTIQELQINEGVTDADFE
ncbi:insulinase family protein [Neptunitalea lumnitzerae]|uniref:Insulinase family protein n=1 Tax=Neptunitalea lumnitzerae TaxID=2965509 RepID=A0ABQ5MGH7_9FLAO|nr:insulinase family protein [Neptunitalea sp. Y10]GLB48401.1 hypothetical protein Y10_07690 [Neptunitalea sp. Y10]